MAKLEKEPGSIPAYNIIADSSYFMERNVLWKIWENCNIEGLTALIGVNISR